MFLKCDSFLLYSWSCFPTSASSGRPRGTRAVPFRPHNDSSGGANVRVQHICAMEEYKDRSPEELRWEDYQLGDFGKYPL